MERVAFEQKGLVSRFTHCSHITLSFPSGSGILLGFPWRVVVSPFRFQSSVAVFTVLGATVLASAADGKLITGDLRPDLRAANRERNLTSQEVETLGRVLKGKSEYAVQ